jgi:hypothetical protein
MPAISRIVGTWQSGRSARAREDQNWREIGSPNASLKH